MDLRLFVRIGGNYRLSEYAEEHRALAYLLLALWVDDQIVDYSVALDLPCSPSKYSTFSISELY